MASEKELNITTKDKKLIHGHLIGSLNKPLVIISHGLTDNLNSRVPYNAGWFFADHGFATYRFSYYEGGKRGRKLRECTLATHAQDLDTIVAYFRRRGVKKIFVVGHSFGGLTILLSPQHKFDGAVLWDPSHPKNKSLKGARYVAALKAYVVNWGVERLIGKAMVDHYNQLDMHPVIAAYQTPTLIVSATKGNRNSGREYYKKLNVPKQLVEIATDHSFTSEGAQAKWFNATLKWLKSQVQS